MAYNHRQIFEDIHSVISSEPGTSLIKLAERLCLDRHTVGKSVWLATGMHFRKYRQINVLQRSQQILAQAGTLSTKQVAQEMGYSTTAAFSRFFKIGTGKTPTLFRKQ